MHKIFLAFAFALLTASNVNADGLPMKTDWDALIQKINSSQPLSIQARKTTYYKNDKLILGIGIDKPGYLNVIAVNENGETVLLFPNRRHPNNKVSVGSFIFPTSQMKFDLVTQAPYGKTLIAAFLSDHKFNLYESFAKKSQTKSLTGENVATEELFKSLSNAEVNDFRKGFEVKAREAKEIAKAGKLELMTCETAESC